MYTNILYLVIIEIVFINLVISIKENSQNSLDQVKYIDKECKVISQCRECSFDEIKLIKECSSNGFISTTECLKVNENNENDFYYI